MQILSPSGAQFKIESAEQEPPLQPNKGFKRLLVQKQKQEENLRITVLFSPVWEDGKIANIPDIVPLNEW
ncbi:hypothetical protein ACFL40_00990 [candidate division KSB1 bacterium]